MTRTLDEAIVHAREVAERNRKQYKNCPADRRDIEHQTCEECAEEHEQLAEWLEELKAYRENSNGYNKEDIELNRKAMYNKAIDDFARGLDYLLVKYAIENTLEPNINDVKFSLDHITKIISRVIEQLKEGGENDRL